MQLLNYRRVKRTLANLRYTPLHPQWFVYSGEKGKCADVSKWVKGRVLDIGCADSSIKKCLSQGISYIGLDYYTTAVEWYDTKPDIFGDAHMLPVASESFDSILLLDVLEHLHDPAHCIQEVARVLKPGGVFYLQVPFIYPEHDAPLDYHRWTRYGLRNLTCGYSLKICDEKSYGKPIETAVLLFNIALAKACLTWFRKKSPAMIITPIIPFVIFLANIFGWLFALTSYDDEFMSHGHCLVFRKLQ